MEFDSKRKVDKPSVVLAGSQVEFARRGTKLVFASTQDDKVQITKIWTGPHSKSEVYEYPSKEIDVAEWKKSLTADGYKLRSGKE